MRRVAARGAGAGLSLGYAALAGVERGGRKEASLAGVAHGHRRATAGKPRGTPEEVVQVAQVADAERDVVRSGRPRHGMGSDLPAHLRRRPVGHLERPDAQPVAAARVRIEVRLGTCDAERQRRVDADARRRAANGVAQRAGGVRGMRRPAGRHLSRSVELCGLRHSRADPPRSVRRHVSERVAEHRSEVRAVRHRARRNTGDSRGGCADDVVDDRNHATLCNPGAASPTRGRAAARFRDPAHRAAPAAYPAGPAGRAHDDAVSTEPCGTSSSRAAFATSPRTSRWRTCRSNRAPTRRPRSRSSRTTGRLRRSTATAARRPCAPSPASARRWRTSSRSSSRPASAPSASSITPACRWSSRR